MADEPTPPPVPGPDPAGTKQKVTRAPRQGATMGEKQAAQQGAAAPPPAVDPTQISPQLLAALSQALGAQTAPPPAAPAPSAAERTLIAREEKRFRRAATAPAVENPPPASEPAAPPPKSPVTADEPPATKTPSEASPIGEIEEARQDAERGVHLRSKETPAAPIPSTGQLWRRIPRERRTLFLVGAAALALCAGTFFLGRATAPAPPAGAATGLPGSTAATPEGASPKPRPPRLAEPAELARVDAALQALTVNDLPRAEAALLQIQKDIPDLPGTLLTLALMELQRGNYPKSDYYLSLGINAGEPPGPYYELRASLNSRTNQRQRAEDALEQAVRAEPYSWRHLFRWAEFLRRLGRNEAALEKLDLAIARVHEQAEEDLMQFKRALILVALGRGTEIDAELARRTAENPPPGEWLLVGLAREAARGNMTAAAGWLQRATRQETAAWLSEQLRDFYLNQWCYEKELAALYRPYLPRAESPRKAAEGSVAAPDADAVAAQARAQGRSPLTAPAEPLPDVASRPPASPPAAAPAATKPAAGAPAASPSPTPPLDLSNVLPPPPK